MKSLLALLILFVTACSVFRFGPLHSRRTASDQRFALLREDTETFRTELSSKFQALHVYHTLGQRFLLRFESEIREHSLSDLYKPPTYLGLLAVKAQVDEIENEVFHLWQMLKEEKLRGVERLVILEEGVKTFSALSRAQSLSMDNIQHRLALAETVRNEDLSQSELDLVIKEMENSPEFQIYEKNIEHISYMLEMDISSSRKPQVSPSTTEEGNLTGDEFSKNVWALTFNQGPQDQNSSALLKVLLDHKVAATFFLNMDQAHLYPALVSEFKTAGHELASGGLTGSALHKVSEEELHTEITESTKSLTKLTGEKPDLFRLPYGAGVSINKIREKIAQSELVHVLWNVDSLDWLPQSHARIRRRTLELMEKTARHSGIILFHDAHPRTLQALDGLLKDLGENRQRICTIGRIKHELNQGQKALCLSN